MKLKNVVTETEVTFTQENRWVCWYSCVSLSIIHITYIRDVIDF